MNLDMSREISQKKVEKIQKLRVEIEKIRNENEKIFEKLKNYDDWYNQSIKQINQIFNKNQKNVNSSSSDEVSDEYDEDFVFQKEKRRRRRRRNNISKIEKTSSDFCELSDSSELENAPKKSKRKIKVVNLTKGQKLPTILPNSQPLTFIEPNKRVFTVPNIAYTSMLPTTNNVGSTNPNMNKNEQNSSYFTLNQFKTLAKSDPTFAAKLFHRYILDLPKKPKINKNVTAPQQPTSETSNNLSDIHNQTS